MTTVLLNSYIKNPDFEVMLHQIHEVVCSNDLVKHYFVLAKKSVVVQDIKRYSSYLTPKSSLEYHRPPSPTASVDIQLPESQFMEINQIIGRVCLEWKVNPEHVAQLTHEILELIEESRSQTNDTMSSKLDAKEVSVDKIQYFLKRYRISSDVMPSKAIMAERGLAHKLWLRIDRELRQLQIEGRIAVSDAAFDDQIDEIMERQARRDSFIHLKPEQDDMGRHRLVARHSLPYEHGIPMRLFVRCLSRFSMELDRVHSSDKDRILRPA